MNLFVAELATSPLGRPPCRVWQVGGGLSLALDDVEPIRLKIADDNDVARMKVYWAGL